MASSLPQMDSGTATGPGAMIQQTPGVHSPGMLSASNGMMPMSMNGGGGGQISLSVLIDFLVQRAYHELAVLGELLPRKTDMERKIEIFNYSARTRMLFVRLLALVKWAGHASKVDKCNSIQMYLDRQGGLLTETADSLARMARETLVRATLPNFHLPAAVEVLTTGKYSRVPRCIRDRIVPPEPISKIERTKIILTLNQIIEHRLVTSPGGRPSRMHPTKIENGRVTFLVENEFEASLTLLSDASNAPWQLLDVTILVQDKDTGEGRSLVHPMQVGFVKQVVQSHLLEGPRPLHGLYRALHCLCQSLQLEVLSSQAQKLISERLGDYIRIEEYKPGACLTISYWRELVLTTASDGAAGSGRAAIQRFGQTTNSNHGAGFCFSIQVDQYDLNQPLTILHTPTLTSGKEARLAEQVIRGGLISLERILVHSIYIRTRTRLADLREDLRQRLGLGDVEPTLHGSPAVLSIPILQPCLRSEQLLVSVDTHSGNFLAHVPQYESNPFITDIQAALNCSDDNGGPGSSNTNASNLASNSRGRNLEWLVSQLRYWITKQRVHKTLQHLPATSYEQLPVLFDLANHPLKDTSQNRMYIRLHHQSNAILITDCKEKETQPCEMDYRYHLLWVKPASIEDDPKDGTVTADIPKVYLKALSMIEFDPFLITHATATKVDVQDLSEKIIGKRKFGGKVEAPIKRTKFPAYFLSDLAHVVAFADERIPFMSMGLELIKRNVVHGDIEIQDRAVGLVIKLIKFPRVKGVSGDVVSRFEKYLMSASIRMQQRGGRFWRIEFVFHGNPVSKIRNGLNTTNGNGRRNRRKSGEKSCRKTILFTYEVGPVETLGETVDNMLKEWSQMVHLFKLVDDLEAYLQCESLNISNYIGIKTYSFKEVTLEYGPSSMNAKSLARVTWDASRSKFGIIFGGDGAASGMCPHLILKDQLEEHLNHHKNLALLGKILHETYMVSLSLSRLPTTPQVGVTLEKVKSPVQTFSVLPQSPTTFKILFYNMYCLDIQVRAGALVYIRDSAISLFDQKKAMEDLQPIPLIKAFLMKYVDEAEFQRRQSHTEDDNPPSPQNVPEDSGMKFPTPHTPPTTNPQQPPSPHGALLQSPPNSNLRQPSPAPNFTVPSPINPNSVGSPFGGNPNSVGSPGGALHGNRPSPRPGIHSPMHANSSQLGHNVSGQPGARNGQPRNRILPQRLWAGANPTPLTDKAFAEICRPNQLQPPGPNLAVSNVQLSPLHRFLGCVFLRRSLQLEIKKEENIQLHLLQAPSQNTSQQGVPNNDPGTIMFKVAAAPQAPGLTCKVSSSPNNSFQSLHLEVKPDAPLGQEWSPDMLHTLQKFFDTNVVAPPYRPSAITAFCRILQCSNNALKDIVAIMKLELQPEILVQSNLKWSCRLCIWLPPACPPLLPLCHPGAVTLNDKLLLFLQLTKVNELPGILPLSFVIPLVYNFKTNKTTVTQKENTDIVKIVTAYLEQLMPKLDPLKCTLFPSVYDMLHNLSIPNQSPLTTVTTQVLLQDVTSQIPTGAPMHSGAMNQQRMMGAQMGMQMRGVAQPGPRMAPPNMRTT